MALFHLYIQARDNLCGRKYFQPLAQVLTIYPSVFSALRYDT